MSGLKRYLHIVLFSALALVASSLLPSVGLAQSDEQQPPATAPKKETRKSPRALMRIFLLAAKDLDKATPEQIDRVLECLDLSAFEEDVRRDQGTRLAQKLESVIDFVGIDLEAIPDEPEGEAFEFHKADGGQVILEREPGTGLWRFSGETLNTINAVHKAIQEEKSKQQQEEEKTKPEEEQQVPAAYRSPRATMTTFLTAMSEERLDDAVMCLDLSEVAAAARAERGQALTESLLFSMNRIETVVYQQIPDDADRESPFIWKQHDAGQIALHKIEEPEERKGYWLFTPGTLKTIDDLSKSLQDAPLAAGLEETASESLPYHLWLRQRIPDWLQKQLLLLEHWQWMGLAALVLAGIMLDRLVVALLARIVERQVDRGVVQLARGFRRSTVRPMGLLLQAALWWWGLKLLLLPDEALNYLYGGVKLFAAAVGVWSFYRLVDLVAGFFQARAVKTGNKLDDLLVPLVRKSLKVAITLIGIAFIVKMAGEDPKTYLTGLSIGGLALAFAAKESLGNLFGSITVLLDRPFQIGDWVIIGDKEGTVESVGFRSTRIRTFYNSIITIPNANCVNSTIDNMGVRYYRRIRVMISATYSSTPDQLEAFCEGIRELIRRHPFTRKDYFHVYVNQFAASSIDILLYCFLRVPDWATELRERQRLFLDIMRLAKKLGIDFAFPTETVHLINSEGGAATPPRPELAGSEQAHALGRREAEEIVKASLGENGDKPPPVVN